jgi:hypothetical protein
MTQKDKSRIRHQDGLSNAASYRRAIQRELDAFMAGERDRLSKDRKERAKQLAARHKLPDLDVFGST